MTKAGAEVTIRLAVPGDVEAIVALDRAIAEVPHWAAGEYRVALAGMAREPWRCMYVAELAGRIAGFAVGRVDCIEEDCAGELETVGVAEGARRRGVGRSLCGAVIAWCRENGALRVELEVRSRSAGPIALYRELGFEAIGSRPRYYRDPADDAMLMRLDLGGEPDRAGVQAGPL